MQDSRVKFDIISRGKVFFGISIVIILCGIVSFVVQGFNFDIDFLGGTSMQIDIEKPFSQEDADKINGIVENVTGEKASSIQKTGDAGQEIIIKMKELESEKRDELFNAIKEEYSLSSTVPLSIDKVGESVGADLRKAAVLSAVVALLLMLIYITIRFELITGLSMVICLFHDLLFVLTVYTVFQVPMNTTFIAAVLTVLGYSINSTIIIYDRVRENRRLQSKMHFGELVNLSIWQTFNRSVFTSITTVLVVALLYFLSVESIKVFTFPIMLGILAGTYSSLFLSGNVWVYLKSHSKQK